MYLYPVSIKKPTTGRFRCPKCNNDLGSCVFEYEICLTVSDKIIRKPHLINTFVHNEKPYECSVCQFLCIQSLTEGQWYGFYFESDKEHWIVDRYITPDDPNQNLTVVFDSDGNLVVRTYITNVGDIFDLGHECRQFTVEEFCFGETNQ